MQVLFVGFLLLDALYRGSPLAGKCKGNMEDSEIGFFQAQGADEHKIMHSQSCRAVDEWHILCKKFTYMGHMPDSDVCFMVGTTDEPGTDGMGPLNFTFVPGTSYRTTKLEEADGKYDVLIMVGNTPLSKLKWLAVADNTKKTILGMTKFPDLNGKIPMKTEIGMFSHTTNGVEGTVTFLDTRTIMITAFSYDGNATRAMFLLGREEDPVVPAATDLTIPAEQGKWEQLAKYDKQNVTIKLPNNASICDGYNWFSVFDWEGRDSMGYLPFGHKDLVLPPDYDQNKPGYGPTTPYPTSADSIPTIPSNGSDTSTELSNAPESTRRPGTAPEPPSTRRPGPAPKKDFAVKTRSSFGTVLTAAILMVTKASDQAG